MPGQLPSTPAFATLGFGSDDPTLINEAHSGRMVVRKRGAQRWRVRAQYPDLKRHELRSLLAFLNRQRGQFHTWTLTIDGESDPDGVATGVPVVRDRSNLLLRSEEFGTSPWGVENATISANQIANPIDGAVTADKLVEDSSVAIYHRVRQGYAGGFATGVSACSIYLKAGERTEANVFLYDTAVPGAIISAYLNLSTGVITNLSGKGTTKTATATSLADGWWYLQMSCGVADTASANLYVSLGSGGTTNYNGNGASGAYIFGAQLERAATPGPYIATTSAAITAQPSSGNSLYADGWSPNEAGILMPADKFRLAGGNKVHEVSEQVDSDAWGNAVIPIYPPLTRTPADNESLIVSGVQYTVRHAGQSIGYDRGRNLYTLELDLIEDVG